MPDEIEDPTEPKLPVGVSPDEMIARAMQSVRMTPGVGAHGWEPPGIAEVAQLFPGYEMLALLGRGGMGAVYQARQPALDRLVAIKLLPLEISVDHDFADRFRREARAMAKLTHPNIIAVHDFGSTSGGHLFIVMEYVEGANLADIIHQVGLDPAQSLSIVEQVCAALGYAHGKGVVHRDIKPANVMIDTESHVKVADFGLARLLNAGTDLGHTMTGTVMGTPDYMAPEQTKGMNVDHRADIYSLGVMIYEMLCREVPKGIFQTPSARTGCDARIDDIVIKAMQQTPDYRYQNTHEMKADVHAARTPLPIAAPPPVATPSSKPPALAKPGLPIVPAPAVKSRTSRYVGIAIAVVAVVSGAVFLAKQKANPLSATANLVQNPSFENVSASGFPVGWKYTVWKGEAAWNVADRASAHAGSRALHVVAPSGGGDTRVVTTAAVKVKRGADYRLSAWVRTKGVSGARGAYVNADLPSRNGGDEKNQAPLYYSRGIIGDTNWTLLEKVISVGDDDEVGISCALGGWGLCLGEAWFDDVSFTEIPRPTAPILSKSPDAVSAAPAAAK